VPARDLIVIGASAGGVEALLQLSSALPADLPAAVIVVLHSERNRPSLLPQLLGQRGPLPAAHPADREPIRPGRIYIAPPDYHLLVEEGLVRLARTATEHYTRPAIDPAFRTAAATYGERVIGVLLTGTMEDGAMGLGTIKRHGGLVIVQDPLDALYPQMPQHAINTVTVDAVLPLSEIAAALGRLTREPLDQLQGAAMASDEPSAEIDPIERARQIVEREQEAQIKNQRVGQPAIFTCPECGGTLWQADDTKVQFRCHVGHVYGGGDLLNHQTNAAEGRLWEVLRFLVDQSILANQLATKAAREGRSLGAQSFSKRAEVAEKHANLIRQLIEGTAFTDSSEGQPQVSQEKISKIIPIAPR
jgi:two-component system, chemotaxis family, protein-glutamate methylesterase/glutaminase